MANGKRPEPVGTFLLVFLLLAGGLVVIQAGTTTAEGKSIWGYVAECGAPLVTPPATVNLVNVYTGEETSQPLAGASYEFVDPAPGYYMIQAEATGYFSAESAIYRFDGTVYKHVADLCLDPYPTTRKVSPSPQLWYNVTVGKSTLLTASENLTIAFTYTAVFNEVATLVNLRYAGGVVDLVQSPLVFQSETLSFDNTSDVVVPRNLIRGVEYAVSNPWTGQITILDVLVVGSMETGFGRITSNYSWAATQKNLQNDLIETAPSPTVEKNGVSWVPTTDWNLNYETGLFTIYGNFNFGADSLFVNYSYLDTITGATVEAWDPGHGEMVATATTPTSGVAKLSLWDGTFDIIISAPTYATRNYTLPLSTHTATRQKLSDALTVLVRATSIDAQPIRDGLVAFMYNQNTAVPWGARIIEGTPAGNQVTFRIPTGTYWLMVDADGYAANISSRVISGDDAINLDLTPSKEERADTTITYTGAGWENIQIARNVRLNADSSIAALDNANLRNTNLQIDLSVGNRDGIFNDQTAFTTWVNDAGPRWVTTEGFFTTNGVAYIHTDGSYAATTSWSGGYLYIFSNATYTRMGATAIKPNLARYAVNVTSSLDTNTTVYVNNTYSVDLPNGYERTSTHADTVTGFTTVTVDPKTTGATQANLVVEKSKLGEAHARVEGPQTRFLELNTTANATVSNYTVAVSSLWNIIYSANATTVGVGQPEDANYTWTWADATPARYGIWTWHNFTAAGNRSVVLTVKQPNAANVTTFKLRTFVDHVNPVASGNANLTPVNEGALVRFDASASTDTTGFAGADNAGRVSEWFWDFDSDGTRDGVGKIVDHAYEEPGTYIPILWVVDWVGHKSANFTLPAITVEDVTKPTISGWTTLHGTTWIPATSAVDEDVAYFFDASTVTDNVDEIADLGFTWTFKNDAGANQTLSGKNVSFTWNEPSTGQTVTLNVTDQAGNWAVFTREQVVQVNLAVHANVQVQDVKADPTTAEEGATTKVTVTVKHVGGNIAASNIRILVKAVRGSNTENVTVSATWADGSASLNKDQTKTVTFDFNVGNTVGNVRIEVRAEADSEPKTWIEETGKSVTVNVKAAGWKGLVVPILFVAILIGIPIAAIVYRKITSGEWELRKQRDEPEGDEEEEEEADEEKEAPKKKKA